MNKNLEVKQNGFKDCGPSCLLSIIRYYGSDASHEELSLLLKTDNNGTSAYNLINGAKSIGFDGYGIKYSYEDIVNSNVTFPIIVHVLKKNMYHYIVIYGNNQNKKILKVMDPDFGNSKITYEEFKSIYLNTSIVLFPIKNLSKMNNFKGIFSYIADYIKLEKKLFVIVFLLSFLLIILSILSNYYLQIIVDNIIPNYLYKKLVLLSYLFLNVLFLKSLLDYIRKKYLIYVTSNIGIKMNNDTIKHFFNLPYQFFKNKSTGEVLSRITDLKSFKDIFSNIIVNVSMDLILIIVSMIVLLMINRNLFLISFVFMIFYCLVVIMYSNKFKKEIQSFQINEAEYNKVLTESIEGYESNRNIDMINYIVKKLETKYIIYTTKYNKFEYSLSNQIYIKDLLTNICYILTIFYGVLYIKEGLITLGNFLVFNSLIVYFTEPLKNILDLEPNLSYMKEVYSRVNDLLIMKSNFVSDTNEMIKGDIKINNLSYSYNNYNNILENINIDIKYGSKYLIYGKSGNGKSTLLKIILKYLSNYKGSITICNRNILDINESLIHSSFTYVSQNDYLINDSLKNNIIYDRDISDEDYEKVIDICHVNLIRDSKVLRNNFVIEDNGFNISGGERQKIILSRALLKKSNYIILDEALSEVGFVEEKEILNKIMNYFNDKTIIYVSHKKEIIDLFENKYYLERRKHDR